MKESYKNKMVKSKYSIKLVPKYVGGVQLDFHIGNKTIRVNPGDELPDLPIQQAKDRNDFAIIKRREVQ